MPENQKQTVTSPRDKSGHKIRREIMQPKNNLRDVPKTKTEQMTKKSLQEIGNREFHKQPILETINMWKPTEHNKDIKSHLTFIYNM